MREWELFSIKLELKSSYPTPSVAALRSAENANGPVRQYFPEDTDPSAMVRNVMILMRWMDQSLPLQSQQLVMRRTALQAVRRRAAVSAWACARRPGCTP